MKTNKILFSILLLLSGLFYVTSCKDPDPVPLTTISGIVKYPDFSGAMAIAPGAVVNLATSAVATTTFDYSTIAGADGSYSFKNLSPGTYYLNATYYTANKNVAAKLEGLFFNAGDGHIITVNGAPVDQPVNLVSSGQTGTEVVQVAYAWDPTASAGAGNFVSTNVTAANTYYNFDNAHSEVLFMFPYRDKEADFQGTFTQISKFNMTFDAANLATSSIVAEVDMSSVNTRTPGGRDNLIADITTPYTFTPNTLFGKLGCISGTFGITADNATPTLAVPQPITVDVDRYAKFTSTSIEKYGDGYLAKGNLVFHGVTKPVSLMFKYVTPFTDTSVTPNKKYVSFEGKFVINAKTDFGLVSASISNLVNIYVSINLNKTL